MRAGPLQACASLAPAAPHARAHRAALAQDPRVLTHLGAPPPPQQRAHEPSQPQLACCAATRLRCLHLYLKFLPAGCCCGALAAAAAVVRTETTTTTMTAPSLRRMTRRACRRARRARCQSPPRCEVAPRVARARAAPQAYSATLRAASRALQPLLALPARAPPRVASSPHCCYTPARAAQEAPWQATRTVPRSAVDSPTSCRPPRRGRGASAPASLGCGSWTWAPRRRRRATVSAAREWTVQVARRTALACSGRSRRLEAGGPLRRTKASALHRRCRCPLQQRACEAAASH